MKQFTLPLHSFLQRPTVYLEQFFDSYAMLDTGSLFPVWVAEEQLLKDYGGILTAQDAPFGGFGGVTKGNIYEIPTFCVGELIFPNFPIIAAPHRLPCQMLFSATMFSHLVYEIDDQNHQLNITVPDKESVIRNLIIKDIDGNLQVFCSGGD